jgi:hypothetical protein
MRALRHSRGVAERDGGKSRTIGWEANDSWLACFARDAFAVEIGPGALGEILMDRIVARNGSCPVRSERLRCGLARQAWPPGEHPARQ